MAWTVRSLDELSSRARGAFRQYTVGSDTSLKNNFVTVVVKVLAGLGHELELRQAYLAKQLFGRSANISMLTLHAADVNIFRKQPAASSGIITGNGLANTIYPAGIRFGSGSQVYVSTSPAQTSPLGTVSFSVTSEGKGAATNRDAGGTLALSDPGLYPTLETEFVVGTDGLGGGADVEDVDAFRARYLFRKANPPGAGKLTDYEQTVRDVPGVLKAWAYRDAMTPSFLVVFFLFKGRSDNIPTSGDVAVVQNAIDAKRLIRVNDSVVEAPTPSALNPIVANLSNDTDEVRSLIDAAIAKVLYDKARPGVSGDVFVLSRSWISEAISGVTGETSHVLNWPLDDLSYTNGHYPVPGTVTYV
ncbi:hypothetical protein ASC97_04315 [Rhizobium sp. Root1203]|uniref:baseplate J/gp47 family protein n=1 Tax=Rhizobium sp. Root1203 TaxID=1736427 RepID=UPI00070C132A|nr:baseplate J/gp47 family protein [Rhizobium sp. Root1203]KQV27607.1 hypothetical protein ASC97_04315 [Rhizobium sp. Root1203]